MSSSRSATWDTFIRNSNSIKRKYSSSPEAQAAIRELLSLLKPVQARLLSLEGADKNATDLTISSPDLMSTIDMKIFSVREVRHAATPRLAKPLLSTASLRISHRWPCSKNKS